MNKIRLILMAVVCFVAMTAVAQVPSIHKNDPGEDDATWYVIKNVETGKFLKYVGTQFAMQLTEGSFDGTNSTGLDTSHMFYVTGSAKSAKIHNLAAGTALLCAGPASWTQAGVAFNITATGKGGVYISLTGEAAASDAFHYNTSMNKVDYYLGNDEYSEWQFIKINDFADIMGLNDLVDKTYEAVENSDIWGDGFWSGLGKWFDTTSDKVTLKDGWDGIFGIGKVTPITEKDHSTLGKTRTDITTAQDILDKYTEGDGGAGYSTIFNYAEIFNGSDPNAANKKYLSKNQTSLIVNGVRETHTNVWQIQNVEGEYFRFYNEASNMYIAAPESTAAGEVLMTSDANKAGVWKVVVKTANTSGSGSNTVMQNAVVQFESVDDVGAYLCLGDGKSVKVVASANNAGATWVVLPVADVSIYDNFYNLATNMVWQYPYYLQENIGLVKKNNIYTSNVAGVDGAETNNLVDGNYSTCFTTEEGGTVYHYLQAELKTAVNQFYFYMKANVLQSEGRPMDIVVEGSNNGNNFTQIANVTTQMDDELFYFSDKITSGTAYKYLRFTIKSVNVGDKAYSLSEFYILPSDADVDACASTIKGFYGTALYSNEVKGYAGDLVALEAQYYLGKYTIENGKVATNDADIKAGQYRNAEWTALQNALTAFDGVDASNDTEKYNKGVALVEALEAFKNSKCSPVFMISSAWENGYSADWALKCNEETGALAADEANAWDVRQWFVNYGLDTDEVVPVNAVEMRSALGNKLLMNVPHSSIEAIEGWDAEYSKMAYNIRLYNGHEYVMTNDLMQIGIVNSPSTPASNQNAAWYFTYVGTSAQLAGLDANQNAHTSFVEALAAFGKVYLQAKYYNDNYDSDGDGGLGEYNYKEANGLKKSGFDTWFASATYYYKLGAANIVEEFLGKNEAGYSAKAINDFVAEAEAHFPNFRLNNPSVGYYYRLRGRYSRNYLLSDINNGTLTMGALTDGAGNVNDDVAAKSILFASLGSNEGTANIFAFGPGRYLKLNGTNIVYDRIPLAAEAGTTYRSQDIYIGTSRTGTEGYFSLAFGSKNSNYLHDGVTKATVASTAASNRFDWEVEVVRELPVPITAAKMATLYVPFELVIPDGVIAYVLYGEAVTGDATHYDPSADKMIDPDKNVFALRRIEGGIIPAGTPVILQGEAKTYYFPLNYVPTLSDEEAKATYCYDGEIENMLQGSHMTTYIQEQTGITHYILSKKNDVVGMYKVRTYSSLTTSDGITTKFDAGKESFQNNGHRAWLPMDNGKSLGAVGYLFSLSMDGDETTGVEHLKPENGEAEGMYDLQGRKLESVKERGIYIIDGKRVFVK